VIRYRVILALVVVFVLEACGATTPSASPSALAVAQPSTGVASPDLSATPEATTTPLPTETPLPTATPSPTPAPTPVPWQSYTSKRFHYKMKYPPGWIVTPGNASTSDQFDAYVYPYVYVYRDVLSRGSVSVSLTATHDIAYYKSHFKAKVIVNKSIKLAGWSGRYLIFNGTTSNGAKLQFQHIIIAKGRVAYFIDMDGLIENAKADRTLFRKIYLTFRPT
jgi:hypothetical protein